MATLTPGIQTSISLQSLVGIYPLPAIAFPSAAPRTPGIGAINAPAEELTGYSPADIGHMSLADFLFPEDRPALEAALRKLSYFPSQVLENIRLQNKAGLVLYAKLNLTSPRPAVLAADIAYAFCFLTKEDAHAGRSLQASAKRFVTPPSQELRADARDPQPAAKGPNDALVYRSLLDLNKDLRDSDSKLYQRLKQANLSAPVILSLAGMASKNLGNYLATFSLMLNGAARTLDIPEGLRLSVILDYGSGRSESGLELVYYRGTFTQPEKDTVRK